MPRYFFHLTDGKGMLADEIGREAPDVHSARKLAESQPDKLLARLNPMFWITDAIGRSFGAVPLPRAVDEAPERIRDWRAWFGTIEEAVAAGYYEVELRSGRFNCSDGARRVLGLPGNDPLRLVDVLAHLPALAREQVKHAAKRLITGGHRMDLEFQFDSAEGERVVRLFGVHERDRAGGVWIAGVCADLSRLHELEQGIWHASHHDSLTGLPNRSLFQDRLAASVKRAANTGKNLALLLIDLDQLRDINARLGMAGGDVALRRLSSRLAEILGGPEHIGRVGEDEFGVILPDLPSALAAERFAKQLCTTLSTGDADAQQGFTVSAGLAMYPDDGGHPLELMEDAELALGRAKLSRSSRVLPFARAMRRERERKLYVLEEVRKALAEDSVFPMYQPKVSLRTGRTVGFEALLRWRDQRRGIQLPGAILDAFEDRELAGQLSARMRDRVLTDVARWEAAAVPFGRIALNASPMELREPGYAKGLLESLTRYGVPPHRLELEVTETALVGEESKGIAEQLRTLSQAGLKIALDDFGTGYGSLIHLRMFPVDVLKIDRSFTMEVGANTNAAVIVGAIINLANSLGLETVAEGVETAEQARFLNDSGCSVAQGFLFSRALPAVDVPTAAAVSWWKSTGWGADLDG